MTTKLQAAVRELGAELGLKGARGSVRFQVYTDHGVVAELSIALDGPECEALYSVSVPHVSAKPGELVEKQSNRLVAVDKFANKVVSTLKETAE